MTLNLHK